MSMPQGEIKMTDDKMFEGLAMAVRCARHLKEKFPNEIMAIKDNTIIEYSKKNKRLMHGAKDHGMGNCNAFYTNSKPHRIIIGRNMLEERLGWLGTNYYSLEPVLQYEKDHDGYGSWIRMRFPCDKIHKATGAYLYHQGGVNLYGEIAIVELMCHELAHHRTKGHAKGFKAKYQKFWKYMLDEMLNGNYAISAYDFKKLNDSLEEQRKLVEEQIEENKQVVEKQKPDYVWNMHLEGEEN